MKHLVLIAVRIKVMVLWLPCLAKFFSFLCFIIINVSFFPFCFQLRIMNELVLSCRDCRKPHTNIQINFSLLFKWHIPNVQVILYIYLYLYIIYIYIYNIYIFIENTHHSTTPSTIYNGY